MSPSTRPFVVLAEDEAPVRAYLANALRDEGYEVLEAANGRELFWLVERARGRHPVDLVISDLMMPAYDGLEVAEAWNDGGDAPRMLLMSAFPDHGVRRRAESLGLVLLEKPFAADYLARIVRNMFASWRGTET